MAGAGRAAPLIGWDVLALAFGIKAKPIRRTILRHAWISFPLVSVIIATSINLVSGLAK